MGHVLLEALNCPGIQQALTNAPGVGVRFRQLGVLDDHHGVTDPSQPPPQET